MRVADGKIDLSQVADGGHALHHDYWSMAVANGADPQDERMAQVRRIPAGERDDG